MTSKSKKSPNDDLVDALESIRGLLEKSETKLSAARESLEKAKSTPVEKRPAPVSKYKKPSISNEPVVPVLDDVVFQQELADKTTVHDDITMTDIPSLDFDAIVNKTEITPPPIPSAEKPQQPQKPSGPSRKAILDYIDGIESSLEQRIHNTILDTMAKVELEIKNAVEEELKALRNMISEKK